MVRQDFVPFLAKFGCLGDQGLVSIFVGPFFYHTVYVICTCDGNKKDDDFGLRWFVVAQNLLLVYVKKLYNSFEDF